MKKLFQTSALFLSIILFAVPVQSRAQNNANKEKRLIVGNSFNVMFPQKDMKDTYNLGLGVYANVDYNLSKHLAARFDLGWNSVKGPETSYADSLGNIHTEKPSMSLWEFTAGLRASVSVLYAELRGGYFTGVRSWGYVPAVGLRLGRFDIQGSYTFAGKNRWLAARVGYYW